MAKGGSGDVLTGILAGVTGQFGTQDWVRVLALGVDLHGRAADLAIEGTDPSGLLAGEIAEAVPRARHGLVQELRANV
jgi:NAD(P)H-hydrate epimerase